MSITVRSQFRYKQACSGLLFLSWGLVSTHTKAVTSSFHLVPELERLVVLDAAAAACCAQRQERSYFSNRLDYYLIIKMYHFISKPGSYSSSDRRPLQFQSAKNIIKREEMHAGMQEQEDQIR